MNTWIWGPPTWKFLHTLSFSPNAPHHAAHISHFLASLQAVLPCRFCRDSYAVFMEEVNREVFDGASLEHIIRQGHLAKWMYKVHEKVNDKLNRQTLEEARSKSELDVEVNTALRYLRKRQIAFDCLVKRFTVRPVAFSDGDMWDMLKLFAINVDNRVQTESRLFFQDWYRFLTLLPLAVHVSGGSSSLVTAIHHIVRASTSDNDSPALTRVPAVSGVPGVPAVSAVSGVPAFNRGVAAQNRQTGCGCTGNNSLMSEMSVGSEKQVFAVATAAVCKDGSCK